MAYKIYFEVAVKIQILYFLVGQHGSAWHSSEAQISTAYRAFSNEKINADLTVNIGLNSVNVSLRALPVHNSSASIDYNERFYWIGSSQMKEEYHKALVKVTIVQQTVACSNYLNVPLFPPILLNFCIIFF